MSHDGRVLHFVPQWLPTSERFVYETLRRSERPSVVVSADPVINRDRFPFSPLVSLAAVRPVPPRWRVRAGAAGLLAASVRYRPALLHVHFGYRLHQALPTARRRRLPLVVSLHGHDVTGLLADDPGFYGDALVGADAVVVPSEFLAERALAAGARQERTHVIPSGVDTECLRPAPLPDEPVVVFAGRFVEKKGIDILAAAWPTVLRRVPRARLLVAGYGELRHLAASVADELLVEPSHADVISTLRRARVVVTPSRTARNGDAESLLLVNLEAQALGRPVVSTRHGGIPEFVDADKSALLVPESDAQALAAALVDVLTDDALARRLAAHGPQVAARHDSAVAARALDALYDGLLD